jgi:hypothetical protein
MALSTNPNYLIEIRSDDNSNVLGEPNPIRILANIPETLMLATGSDWGQKLPSTPLDNLLQSLGNIGSLIDKFSTGRNFKPILGDLTFQVWESSSPLEFNLQLLFDAENDAYEDVVKPIQNLQKLSMPYYWGAGFMLPPGPSLIERNRGRISLRIGRFLAINSVILPTVNVIYSSRFDAKGQPISAQVEMTVRTVVTPDRSQYSRFYIYNSEMDTDFGVVARNPGKSALEKAGELKDATVSRFQETF